MTLACRIWGCRWVVMRSWEQCVHGCCLGPVVDESVCARCFDVVVVAEQFVVCRRPLRWDEKKRKVYRDG